MMPVDLFEKHGVDPNGPRDLFAEHGIDVQQHPQSSGLFQGPRNAINFLQHPSMEGLKNAFPSPSQSALISPQAIGKAAYDIPVGLGYGAGTGLTNLANKLPGVNLPNVFGAPHPGVIGDIASSAGQMLPLSLATALTGGAAAAPEAAGLMAALPGALGRAGLMGSYSGLTAPQGKEGEGALTGALASAGVEGAMGIPAGIRALKGRGPEAQMQNMLSKLSGAKNVDQAAEDARRASQTARQQQDMTARQKFGSIEDKIGKENIYPETASPLSGYPASSSYERSKLKDMLEDKDLKLSSDAQDALDRFIDTKNFSNAHNLQSVLGKEAQSLKSSGKLEGTEKARFDKLKDTQKTLQNDMDNFVSQNHADVLPDYKDAKEFYKVNVAKPYLNNKLAQRVTAYGQNEQDISNSDVSRLFNSGKESVKKIAEHMGPEAVDNVVYSMLAKQNVANDPRKLANTLDKIINEKGIGSFISPELKMGNDTLKHKIATGDILKGLGTTAGGAIAAHTAGVPWEPAIGLGALAGGAAAGLPRYLGRNIGVHGTEKAISSLSSMGPNSQLRDALVKALTGTALSRMNTGQ